MATSEPRGLSYKLIAAQVQTPLGPRGQEFSNATRLTMGTGYSVLWGLSCTLQDIGSTPICHDNQKRLHLWGTKSLI